MAMKTYSLGADRVVLVKDDLSEISIREQGSEVKRAFSMGIALNYMQMECVQDGDEQDRDGGSGRTNLHTVLAQRSAGRSRLCRMSSIWA